MKVQMKPETVGRRAAERVANTAARTAHLTDRLAEKAAAAGPGSIWAEMLAERNNWAAFAGYIPERLR